LLYSPAMTIREYELYVPTRTNQGRVIPAARLARLKKRLLKRFGGLTHFPQQNEGLWKWGNVTFRDEIVILRVLSGDKDKAFWRTLKKDLERKWGQQSILIIEREITMV